MSTTAGLSAAARSLLSLLADGGFHSGEAIAASSGCSRTGVWKRIEELRALGVEVYAVPGMGYRLAHPLELLDGKVIAGALTGTAAEAIGLIEVHAQLASTNDHLMRRAAEGAPAGTVCLAERQSAGKGRIGRAWVSPLCGNVYLSLLWRFGRAGFSGLSLAVGVAAVRALRAQGISDAALKWPNDVLWSRRKLGGILIEVTGEANGQYAVVIGIGLNMNLPDRHAGSIDQDWVDLARIPGGAGVSRNRLIAGMLNELAPMLAGYETTGLAPYLEEWRGYHSFEGAQASVQQGDRVWTGRIVGVSAEGLLLLACEDGPVREFASGDVRVRAL
ncbi:MULTISPECIES: biotin--[acetyl-CoA-carboxylase] ligase [Methylococcus]|uniref:Bifunctional ligase/repressor BirA n=1 Tax=Methylococcus capsulatus TaxID=414 RepID=A0ABZ2F4D2_METCP|nr:MULTISPECIES: biotin--[acetyl-CoA-carboxylase] ligase [Methylococcus]MDF9393413.1 biotin--[acetyl-CoA-carboxylase] ligase [Methylococcus capsulatus]